MGSNLVFDNGLGEIGLGYNDRVCIILFASLDLNFRLITSFYYRVIHWTFSQTQWMRHYVKVCDSWCARAQVCVCACARKLMRAHKNSMRTLMHGFYMTFQEVARFISGHSPKPLNLPSLELQYLVLNGSIFNCQIQD